MDTCPELQPINQVRSLPREAILQVALENFNNIVFIKNRSHQFVYMNQECLKHTHKPSLADIIGKCEEDLFPLEQAAYFREITEEVFQKGGSRSWETKITLGDNEQHVLLTLLQYFEFEGEAYLIGMGHDITETRYKSETVRTRETEAAFSARYQTLNEITSLVAHQVNQPLTAIDIYVQGCLRKLEEDSLSPGELKLILSNLAKQSSQVSKVINSFRSLTEPAQTELSLIDVNQTVLDTLLLIRPITTQEKILVNHNLLSNLPKIPLDSVQFQQIILNIFQNSVEVFRETDTTQPRILITTSLDENAQVKICIRDNGPGIQPEVCDKLFDANFSTKKDPNRMGLGLAICQTFVERHGGRIYINPGYNRGAEFVILLKQTA